MTIASFALIIFSVYTSDVSTNGDLSASLAVGVANAKTEHEISSLFRDKLRSVPLKDVRLLSTNENETIALYSAWEVARRSLPDLAEDVRIKVGSDTSNYFVGFVEGRLKVVSPPFWSRAILGAEYGSSRSIYFDFREHDKDIRHLQRLDLKYQQGSVTLDEVGGGIKVSSPSFSFTLSDANFMKFVCNRTDPSCYDAYSISPKDYVFHTFSIYHPSGKIGLIDGSSNRIVWQQDVYLGSPVLISGRVPHGSAVVANKDTVFVFGYSLPIVYIQQFSVADGRRLLRFSAH